MAKAQGKKAAVSTKKSAAKKPAARVKTAKTAKKPAAPKKKPAKPASRVAKPVAAVKKAVAKVTAKRYQEAGKKEKKQMLDDLKEALKAAQPIQYPTNIELVTKYFDKLDAVLQ